MFTFPTTFFGGDPRSLGNMMAWYDAQDASTITKAYVANAATASGTSGTTALVTSSDISKGLQPGEKFRLLGTDVYTVQAVATTNITTVETLTANYVAAAIELQCVSQWNDKTKNANNLTQATGSAQPIFISQALNSKPALRFDALGTASKLAVADNSTLKYSQYYGLVVFHIHTDNAATRHFVGKWNTTSNKREFRFRQGSTDIWTPGQSPTGTASENTAAAGSALASGSNNIGEGWYDGTNINARINNGTVTQTASASVFNGNADLSIGDDSNAAAPVLADIGEVMLYSSALTTAQRAYLYAYAKAKWGL